ncbi:hypothetical protein NIES2101_43475 [Calothrix sp. HK-06]|nr:hypothetical protein NIES2101_43475 [Calothrix sp. HK-06]
MASKIPTTIYGYSLFAPDVNDNGNPANLLDWKNAAFFPQNTPNALGGLDLLSSSGRIATAVPEPSAPQQERVRKGGLVSMNPFR